MTAAGAMASAASTIVTCEHCGTRNRVAVAAEGIPRCGNCHRPLPWIVDVALTRPLDEALQAAVIRLYHAAGRRSDAVQTYLHICQRLRNDLGLDPGPELSAAYRNVLLGQRSQPVG